MTSRHGNLEKHELQENPGGYTPSSNGNISLTHYLVGAGDTVDRSRGIEFAIGQQFDFSFDRHESILVEGYDHIDPDAGRWVTENPDFEPHLYRRSPTESLTVELSEKSTTVIPKPRTGTPNAESSRGSARCNSKTPSSRNIPESKPTYSISSFSQAPNLEPNSSSAITAGAITTASKIKRFLKSTALGVGIITIVSVAVGVITWIKTKRVQDAGIAVATVFTALLIAFGLMRLMWRGEDRKQERQKMKADAAAEETDSEASV